MAYDLVCLFGMVSGVALCGLICASGVFVV